MTDVLTVLAVDQQQLPEDVGKAGPIGLALIVALLIAVALLVKSMSRHLKRVPRSFDPDEQEQTERPGLADVLGELVGGRPHDRHRTVTSERIPAKRSSSGVATSTSERASS